MRLSFPAVVFCAALLGLALTACNDLSRESAGEYWDDTAISTRVRSDLMRTRIMQPHKQIHVETFKGHVTLGGQVDSRKQADKALGIARAVPTVTGVTDEMVIRGEQRSAPHASAPPQNIAPDQRAQPVPRQGQADY